MTTPQPISEVDESYIAERVSKWFGEPVIAVEDEIKEWLHKAEVRGAEKYVKFGYGPRCGEYAEKCITCEEYKHFDEFAASLNKTGADDE